MDINDTRSKRYTHSRLLQWGHNFSVMDIMIEIREQVVDWCFNGATTFQLWILKKDYVYNWVYDVLQWGHNFSVMDIALYIITKRFSNTSLSYMFFTIFYFPFLYNFIPQVLFSWLRTLTLHSFTTYPLAVCKGIPKTMYFNPKNIFERKFLNILLKYFVILRPVYHLWDTLHNEKYIDEFVNLAPPVAPVGIIKLHNEKYIDEFVNRSTVLRYYLYPDSKLNK